MGTHSGNEGQVKLGSNTVAEITEFEFSTSVTPVEDTSMGDAWKTHIIGSGIAEWSGSITCHWDEADTNGQVAMTTKASVTLNLYPEGSATGAKYYTGTASITQVGVSQRMDGGTVQATYSFTGNGALTVATAS